MGSHRVGHDWSDLAAASADPTLKDPSQQKSKAEMYFRFWWMLWDKVNRLQEKMEYLLGTSVGNMLWFYDDTGNEEEKERDHTFL